MATYTVRMAKDENIVLTAADVRRLIAAGSGDGALLYLALLDSRGQATTEQLLKTLRWDNRRLEQAESALTACGLLGDQRPDVAAEPADQRPAYTREDIYRQLEEDPMFAMLTKNVEGTLGKRMTVPDLEILLGLYNYLGMPCDVIFLLVNHCLERITARYGAGRRPTLRQIEQEGYAWARRGLLDLDSANGYLMKYAKSKTQVGRYMQALHLGDRGPSPSEEKFLLSWVEMGFPVETVELAYDKTIMKCKELRWGYINKILTNWHGKNLHTLQEVEEGDRRPTPRNGKQEERPTAAAAGENAARMKKYLEKMQK